MTALADGVTSGGMHPWRVLASRTLLERRWLTIHEQRVRTSSGAELDEFHLIEAPDWVGVLAATETDQIVLVEQYRHGAAQSSLELPAGVIDAGESPLEAAQRELLEETGYQATRLTPLSTVFPEPARHTNRAHFFFGEGAIRWGEPRPDESESIAVRLLDKSQLVAAIETGALIHGAHVGAIFLAIHRGLLR